VNGFVSTVMILLITVGCAAGEWRYLPESPGDERELFVINHGWHTGIVISESNLGPDLEPVRKAVGEAPFYEFGWGDFAFYQSEDITTSLTLKAVFWPTRSVVQVLKLSSDLDSYFLSSEVIALRVSEEAHDLISVEIGKSFARDDTAGIKKIRSGKHGFIF